MSEQSPAEAVAAYSIELREGRYENPFATSYSFNTLFSPRVKTLANQMEKFGEQLERYPGMEIPGAFINLTPDASLSNDGRGMISLSVHKGFKIGLGRKGFEFYRIPNLQDSLELPVKQDLSMPQLPNVFVAEIHTDGPTYKQVQTVMSNRRLLRWLRTEYFFSKNGLFEKICWLPKEVEDNRPDLYELPRAPFKKVRSPLTEGDLAVGQFLCDLVERYLKI